MNIIMLFYHIYTKPCKKRSDLIELTLYEIIILVTNITILIYYIFDQGKYEESGARLTLSNIIIGCFFSFSGTALSFLGYNLLVASLNVYKLFKKEGKEKGALTCVQILALPF